MHFKEYFRWVPDLPKKPSYDWEEVKESMKQRREKRFQNLLLNTYYWFYRKLEWIWKPYIIEGYVKRGWQICTKGWSDKDCWSLDYTIAKFVLPRLIRLKEMKHGTPTAFFPKDKWKYTKKEEKAAIKKWEETLDEMIFAMDYIANCRESNYYPKKENPKAKDYAPLKKAQARAQSGFELFGKYFMSLWD
jgi:hypothetical protein